MNNIKVGIVSGYFNPIHRGHIEYINSAKDRCDHLICIVNNDNQVKLKKSKIFMDEKHRLYIIENIKSVDSAIIAIDQDSSVSKTIQYIKEILLSDDTTDISFFNSGDRSYKNQSDLETKVCNKYNIKQIFIDLPKIFSSSELKRNLPSDYVE